LLESLHSYRLKRIYFKMSTVHGVQTVQKIQEASANNIFIYVCVYDVSNIWCKHTITNNVVRGVFVRSNGFFFFFLYVNVLLYRYECFDSYI